MGIRINSSIDKKSIIITNDNGTTITASRPGETDILIEDGEKAMVGWLGGYIDIFDAVGDELKEAEAER